MTPKKKKKSRNLLKGSSKMARLQGASKPAATVKKISKASPLASASCADAAIATPVVVVPELISGLTVGSVVPETSPPVSVVEDTNLTAGEHLPTSKDIGELSPQTLAKDIPFTLQKDSQEDPLPVITAEAEPVEANLSGLHSGAKSYASLLKQSAILEELGTPSEHVSGAPFVLIPDENIAAAKEEFREFIYARFHGDWPSMGRIIGVVNAVWAKSGPRIFVHNIGQGEFLLKVTNAKTREHLLTRSCWNVAGYPMFVAPWSPDFTPEEAPITSAVVPVEMRDVPYLLFNQQSLSRLATAVGKPVSLAPETERKENFQVAKLFVRVDLTKELPTKIITGFTSGREVEISVSYPWLPMKCEACGKYGHLRTKCRTHPQDGGTGRKRSVSPPGDKAKERPRGLSRKGRGMESRRTGHSVGAKQQVKGEKRKPSRTRSLEEGEIPADKPAGDTVFTSPEPSTTTDQLAQTPMTDATIHSAVYVSPSLSEDPGEAESEDPFLLVNHQRCGRKVAKSI
ncbi:Uncharacterized protein Rs2_29289 [Raphanus sativus]|nr:Uncharacterized protein Rs2_29289 [Raphanus sativus]